MISNVKRIHFVGIGGSGMSGIAEVLKRGGFEVSGSDISPSATINHLKKLGCRITIGHSSKNIKNADVVVVSSAVGNDNVEVVAANRRKIPVIQRAEMLAELMRIKYGIAIAGTHGKTSTTSTVGQILFTAGYDPTIVVGGVFKNIATGGYSGKGDFLVAEADESDASFLKLSPVFVIVTNIDDDHISFYGDMDNLKQTFVDFINSIPFYGLAVMCADDINICEILPQIRKKYVTYGFSKKADYKIEIKKKDFMSTTYDLFYRGKKIGTFTVPQPGIHNVLNSASAVVLCHNLGVRISKIKEGLKNYLGVARRFEIKGIRKGIIFVDDYAHHPTEIKATLKAARETWPERRIFVLFQPHRYTRTKEQAYQLGRAFEKADAVCILPIYSAGEKEIPGITSQLIWQNIPRGIRKKFFLSKEEAIQKIPALLQENDVFITVGAGDVFKIGEKVLKKIKI